jgi:Leucine-rich repeat (LRR) protein
MTEPAPTPPAKRRKRFGLSLRVLMVLVLLLGGGMGWYAYRARVQREAVAAIEAAGGKAYYDFEWKYQDNGPVLRFYSILTPRKPRWPKWLVDRVGPDYLGSVIGVQFLHGLSHEADDSLLAQIGRLSALEDLDFRGYGSGYTGQSRLTDAGLAQLRELTRLRRLRLGASKIKGAGLLHLSGLRGLTNLDLENIQIADDDAKALSSLTMLEGLLIDSDELTDAGMVHLAPLKQLKCLDLRAQKVTATGLRLLKGWSQLEHLSLWKSGINDDSFLREFPRLITLNLSIRGPARGLFGLFRRNVDPAEELRITSLGTLSNLRDLSLTCFPYPESLLEQIGRLQGLKTLRIGFVDNVPSEDFRHLSRLTHLESLSMIGSSVTDSALSNLAELKRLKSLSLTNTSIGDAGLRYLSGLIELETLQLDHTKISDAGLMHLVPLKKCKKLTVVGTRVSVDGFSEFRAKQEGP